MYIIWLRSENCRGTESLNTKGEKLAGGRDKQKKWKAIE